MCMVDYGEPARVYRDHLIPHARKAHICDECRRSIEKGEPYKVATMLYDGSWSTWKTCQHCLSAQAWLNAECGGFLHGGVGEDLEEHRHEWFDGNRVTLLRLIVGMRRQWHCVTRPDAMMPVRAVA